MSGVWLWHAGLLTTHLLVPATGFRTATWTAFYLACVGALLMPCAITHAVARLWRTGLARLDRCNPWHLAAYLPMLALVPLAGRLETPATADLLMPLLPFSAAYLLWTSVVNAVASAAFWRLRRRPEYAAVRSLFTWVALLFLGGTILHWVAWLATADDSSMWGHSVRLAGAVWPALAVMVLAYFMAHHDVLELLVDRSFVYAGALMAVVLLHQLVYQEFSAALPEAGRAALTLLELGGLAAIVLACRPLRRRWAEALRYLMGAYVAERRERLQRLATAMSAQAGLPDTELLAWFGAALRDALEVDFTAGWLVRGDGSILHHWGNAAPLDGHTALGLMRRMCANRMMRCTPRDAADADAADALCTAGASLAVTRTFGDITGLLLIGKHRRNALLNDEEVHAVLLLVEQLAATLHNVALEAERRAAERRAAQAEKLSALGLLASSIAHEVRNPLSAIKTITAVLGEDLGPASAHAEDIRLILGEIDRLAATTNQLLAHTRPASVGGQPGSVAAALSDTRRLLGHRAREQNSHIEWQIEDTLPAVRADDPALREIFLNLICNALDAAGPGGRVSVACAVDADCLVAEVSDNGPGVPDETRGQLFEPFLTTKAEGTGLGLYAVGRRVREWGGAITCDSEPGRGAKFTVRLPLAMPAAIGSRTGP
jgi:signal transduction histidine kinase